MTATFRVVAVTTWEPKLGGLLVEVGGIGHPNDYAWPPGYSRVWRAIGRHAVVCAPVPLNFLLWQLPWRWGAFLQWLANCGVLVGPEGELFREMTVEWRPWRWRGRRFA